MLSKKSYFKPALFWDDIRRFSPIWVCGSLAMLALPFTIWLHYQDFLRTPGETAMTSYAYYTLSTNFPGLRVDINIFLLEVLAEVLPIALLIYAIFPAMALLHYLYQSRSALGIHALPITRTQLFVTHYLAGIAMMLLPLLIFCVATIPILVVTNTLLPTALLYFCAGALGIYTFYFSFAVFCGMFTGQLWGLPVFYAIFNGLAPLTFVFFVMLAGEFLFGFSSYNLEDTFVQHLTPVWQFVDALYCESITSDGAITFWGLGTVLVYAVVGLLFAAAAYGIFSRRQLERAGEIVSVNILRPIFTICLGVYGGFCALMLYCYLFSSTDTGWMFFFLLLGSLFGTAVGRMLLEKTLAVFTLRNLKQMALVMVFSCLCLASIRFDLLGYEPFIPESEDIESVSISSTLYADGLRLSLYNGDGYTATGDADIELLRAAHAAILADYAETGEDYPTSYSVTATLTSDNEPSYDGTDPILGDYTYYNRTEMIDFTYTLTTGQKITRSYYIRVSGDELAREGSPLSYLEAFANGIDVAPLLAEMGENSYVSLYRYDLAENYYTDDGINSVLAADAMEAVIADLQENGTVLSLLQKEYAAATSGQIYFSVYRTEQGDHHETTQTYVGSVRIDAYPDTNTMDYLMEQVTGEDVDTAA